MTLSAPSGQTVTVVARTAGGTATAGSDYTAVGPTTLTFPPGTTTQSVSVPVLGDTLAEPDETFAVNLARSLSLTRPMEHLLTVQGEHVRMFEAIEAGDAAASRLAMRTHIENACRRVFEGPGGDGVEALRASESVRP